ncbi:hypothetical protein V2J09_002958 [Rumex salicifolius]
MSMVVYSVHEDSSEHASSASQLADNRTVFQLSLFIVFIWYQSTTDTKLDCKAAKFPLQKGLKLPDLAYASQHLSQFVSAPLVPHLEAAQHVVRHS